MKTALILIGALFIIIFASAQIAVNTTGANPDASAGLDVNFTNKGVLIPRIALSSATDNTTIPASTTSLLVYSTGTGGLTPAGYYYWNGSQWVMLGLANHTHATLTFNNSGSGGISGSTYDGSSSLTVSYNTIGSVGGSGTATQVAFWNSSNTLSSSSNLFWNNTDSRLGVGTSSPSARIHATGEIYSTSDYGDIVYIGGDNLANDGEIGIQSSNRNIITLWNRTQIIASDVNLRDISNSRHLIFSGSLQPGGNAGFAGQALVSQGSGNVPVWSTVGGGLITFINPINILTGYTGNNGSPPYSWQTFSIGGQVPPGTKQVVAQVHWAISGPDSGTIDAYLLVRKNSSSSEYVVARGRSSGSKDNVAEANQVIIPIDESSLSFQYAVSSPGFNGGIYFQIIGYY